MSHQNRRIVRCAVKSISPSFLAFVEEHADRSRPSHRVYRSRLGPRPLPRPRLPNLQTLELATVADLPHTPCGQPDIAGAGAEMAAIWTFFARCWVLHWRTWKSLNV